MSNFVRKITSRKFIVAIVGVIVGLAAAFGVDASEYAQVAGLVTTAASIVAYIVGESKIDAAASVPLNVNFPPLPDDEEVEEEIVSEPEELE